MLVSERPMLNRKLAAFSSSRVKSVASVEGDHWLALIYPILSQSKRRDLAHPSTFF